MGGQACVFYGAVEFSRDLDLAFFITPENISKFNDFLKEIEAEVIAVPEFTEEFLRKGHAIHFRSKKKELLNLRIDIMSKLRGVDDYQQLWGRRTEIVLEENLIVNLMSLPDLVKAKKTARDKDWPMIRSLVEVNYLKHKNEVNDQRIDFWLTELRSIDLLIEVANKYQERSKILSQKRPLLKEALNNDKTKLEELLQIEEKLVRETDKKYWLPLKEELEMLRHSLIK